MARQTPPNYRNFVIYEIYVRNHGIHGTFADVEMDLNRIHALGVDIIWFMPIHPIGLIARKGSKGSPYSIANYREINPEYGTKGDFAHLIATAHSLGLKVMIDVVYNHTAHDAVLVQEHPEYYHQDASGHPVTTVPEWSDVIDLNYANPDLQEYLIETLQGWVRFGVDGFRCDVASLVPAEFWEKARIRCAEINPNVIWLAESVHAAFVGSRRQEDLQAISDSELYNAGFDLTYDYDIWAIFQAAATGKVPLSRYLETLRLQDCIYPQNFVKMRCVENHDQARIMLLAPTRNQALAWTAFQAFNRGAFLIYAGQESASTHTPNLFEDDLIPWGNYELSDFLTKLANLKKDLCMVHGKFTVISDEPVVVAVWESIHGHLIGIFNLSNTGIKSFPISLPDGIYSDILSENKITIREGMIASPETAVIFQYTETINPTWFYSPLLDYFVPRDSP